MERWNGVEAKGLWAIQKAEYYTNLNLWRKCIQKICTLMTMRKDRYLTIRFYVPGINFVKSIVRISWRINCLLHRFIICGLIIKKPSTSTKEFCWKIVILGQPWMIVLSVFCNCKTNLRNKIMLVKLLNVVTIAVFFTLSNPNFKTLFLIRFFWCVMLKMPLDICLMFST